MAKCEKSKSLFIEEYEKLNAESQKNLWVNKEDTKDNLENIKESLELSFERIKFIADRDLKTLENFQNIEADNIEEKEKEQLKLAYNLYLSNLILNKTKREK